MIELLIVKHRQSVSRGRVKSRLGPGTPELQRGSQSILGRKLDERLESCEERDRVTKGERGWLEQGARAVSGVRAAAAGSPGGAA